MAKWKLSEKAVIDKNQHFSKFLQKTNAIKFIKVISY